MKAHDDAIQDICCMCGKIVEPEYEDTYEYENGEIICDDCHAEIYDKWEGYFQ